jgi:branched-chain amino acid transport system substrate-binding protein
LTIAGVLSILGLSPSPAQEVIRIGVLNDQSGPYAAYQGPGSVIAAQMAVEDYGGKAAGKKVEVVAGDHQNKSRHRRRNRAAVVRK